MKKGYALLPILIVVFLLLVTITVVFQNNKSTELEQVEDNYKSNLKTFKDDTYKFTFNLPSYYDLNPRPHSNSSFSNAVWNDFGNTRTLNIDTSDGSAWESNGGASVRDLKLVFHKDLNYESWKDRTIKQSNPNMLVRQEIEYPNGINFVTFCGPYCEPSLSRDSFLIIPVENNLLEIKARHFIPNQPEVNSLFSTIYSTFRFIE